VARRDTAACCDERAPFHSITLSAFASNCGGNIEAETGRVLGLHLFIGIRFPYRRWLRLVILDLSCTFAVRTVVTVAYPATAITTRTNLHC
jgi:hypothetical protein